MTRIILVAALLAGCEGGKGGGGGNAQLRQACTKICTCLEESGSTSGGSFSTSGGASCVDECVNDVTSSSGPIVSSSGGSTGPSQACLSCIDRATCDDLTMNNACSAECAF